MLDRINLLFRFRAIAEAGSLRKAAEHLNITQPALSRSLSQLERAYGQPLLERHARGIRPTGFGLRLLSTISRISRDWELAELDLVGESRKHEGLIRVNAGPLWAAVVLPPVIARLHELYANLTIEVGYQVGAIAALLEGRIDVSFGGIHQFERGKGDLMTRHFTVINDRVIARADHPIQSEPADNYEALHNYPWIIYTADPIYEAETIHMVVERTGSAPQIRVRSASFVAIMRLLKEGDYLCVLPDAAVSGNAGHELKPIPIDLGRRSGPSGAVYRGSLTGYRPFNDLLELCQDYFDQRQS